MAMACMHQIPSRSRQDSTQARKGVAFCVKLGGNNHTRVTTRLMRAHSVEVFTSRSSV
ncbi:hypothetical protein CGRA01v4_12687 [Colletotrichum graminicola]|nr:hypothetical protein CGRA01v4_12687 [Colletotrichum graminicola]